MSTAVTPRGTLSAADAARRAAAPQVRAARRPVGDLSLDVMRLRGRTISADLRGILTDATIERTIDGASTLTLSAYDSSRRLIRSGVLHRGAELAVNGLGFVLVAPSKQDDTYGLTFEDREVWALRQLKGPRKATRSSKVTRAKFIESLVREVKRPRIDLWAPERDVVQPVATSDGGTSQPYEFTVGTTTGTGDTPTSTTPASEQDGEGQEDYWTAIRRLADEVQWRAYMVGGVLHLARDQTILAQATRWAISERTPGVDRIAWSIDEGQVTSDATVTCQAERWAAPPGSVVRVSGEGPADGLWIVAAIRRPLSSVQAQVTLTRPREALPEPASAAQSAPTLGAVNGEAPANVQAAYRTAEQLAARGMPYAKGTADCSWWVSQILIGGGMLSGRLATGGLMTWGAAGEGQFLTVWVKDTPGSPFRGSHTFIQFKGFPHSWSEAGGGSTINGWRSGKGTAGYTARHYPGT